MLPKDYSYIPYFFNRANKKLFNSSMIQKQNLISDTQQIFNDYNTLINKKVIANVSKEQFLKAVKIIESRFFIIDLNSKQTSTVIPLLDLFNYDNKPNRVTWGYNQQKHAFQVIASSDIKKGQEVKLPLNTY